MPQEYFFHKKCNLKISVTSHYPSVTSACLYSDITIEVFLSFERPTQKCLPALQLLVRTPDQVSLDSPTNYADLHAFKRIFKHNGQIRNSTLSLSTASKYL